jgi:hypothetical protein
MDRIAAKRAGTGLIATLLVLGAVVGAGVASHVRTASATPPTPPFTQCPPVGLDTSCAVLIVFNPDGSRTTFVDPTQVPFDGFEDTLVGVQNNSSSPVTSLALTGPGIFGFDGDWLGRRLRRPSQSAVRLARPLMKDEPVPPRRLTAVPAPGTRSPSPTR